MINIILHYFADSYVLGHNIRQTKINIPVSELDTFKDVFKNNIENYQDVECGLYYDKITTFVVTENGNFALSKDELDRTFSDYGIEECRNLRIKGRDERNIVCFISHSAIDAD